MKAHPVIKDNYNGYVPFMQDLEIIDNLLFPTPGSLYHNVGYGPQPNRKKSKKELDTNNYVTLILLLAASASNTSVKIYE